MAIVISSAGLTNRRLAETSLNPRVKEDNTGMMNYRKAFIFAGLLWMGYAAAAYSAEYFVAPNGKDSNPGTLSEPFESINRAQRAAHPGDTVYLRGGVYKVREDQIAKKERIWAYVFDINKSGSS